MLFEAKPKKSYCYVGILLILLWFFFLYFVISKKDFAFIFFFIVIFCPILIGEASYLFLAYYRKRIKINSDNCIIISVFRNEQIVSYKEITKIVVYNNGMLRIYKENRLFTMSSAYDNYCEILRFFIQKLPEKIIYNNQLIKF